MTTPNRRTQQRYEIRLPVEFTHEGQSYQGQTRNMSVGGMFIETAAPIPFNGMVGLKFRVPTNKDPIEVEGHVRWVEGSKGASNGLGVQFQGLRAVHVWALNKFFTGKKLAP